MSPNEPLLIRIVYDNHPYDDRLQTNWGFSAWVEYRQHTLLFDTGADPQTLLANMQILGLDPQDIDSIFLSHAHDDHTGGLLGLLAPADHPPVYLLSSFPASFQARVGQNTRVIQVSPGQSIAEGFFSTGAMGHTIPEQALVLSTGPGLVVVTGCAHPGITAILEQAQDMYHQSVLLVVGGFHLKSMSQLEIKSIQKDFRKLGVRQVAPCHCTGDLAITMFAAEYGDDFVPVGVGQQIKRNSAP